MVAINLRALVDRMSPACRQGLERAAGLALSRGHHNVELEHWLLKLVEEAPDAALVLQRFGVDPGRVTAELLRGLERMATGNTRPPGLSPDIVTAAKAAWLFASVERGEAAIRSGHLLWAVLAEDDIARRTRDASPSLGQVVAELLGREFDAITAASSEAAEASRLGTAADGGGTSAGGAGTKALDRFTHDLTAQARAGKLDPVLGRDGEIRQITDILLRRRQNNPILTGEAGVGKTAVVEGFAARVAAGDVPPPLREIAVRTLDLGLLQAGAGMRGEFEERLKSVIDEVTGSPVPIVLFIDEAHTLVGAGGQAGQNDAANLLKPALARGTLRTIAATTWAEYKKYFERDAALSRRFQVVKVDEPEEDTAIAMVRGLLHPLEAHHGVRILDEAVVAAVRLSTRYIPSRQLPDKAVSLLDTACARVAMSRAATPPALEERIRGIGIADTELAIVERELALTPALAPRAEALRERRAGLEAERDALAAQWESERGLIARAEELRDALEAPPAEGGGEAADPGTLREALRAAEAELAAFQGEQPLVFPRVDAAVVAEIVQSWTGIPAGRMRGNEIRGVLELADALRGRIVGQDHALDAVARAIRVSRAKLTDPRKPVGVFLMVGTSGVGKTETALALADLLYGGEQSLTTINMSEFKEEHKVSMLLGSPPGYVGYGEGGVMTEAVRRRPYSVLLLDEIEKAHPGVQDVFYQCFDKGTMKDGEGRDIDFRHTVIIMTSNAGSELIASVFADPDTAPDAAGLGELLAPELGKHFKPAFLGRVTVVPYLPLQPDTLERIVALQLRRIAERMRGAYGTAVRFADGLAATVAADASNSPAGARSIESILSGAMLPGLSGFMLERLADGAVPAAVAVTRENGTFAFAAEG
ncbi:MAG: type VI secretion system ATPase TssH [Gluconacetobacter diazotrophicus]|nr:type VI secretion system ATPase TssH [Gluconacetobacter diazotrophicus]